MLALLALTGLAAAFAARAQARPGKGSFSPHVGPAGRSPGRSITARAGGFLDDYASGNLAPEQAITASLLAQRQR